MLAPDSLIHNRYRVVRQIGQGGMGAVYEAIDTRLRSTVALKQMTVQHDERLVKAFEREAQLLAGLRHPALPRVIDHFADDVGNFLVMDFIPGSDLAALLNERNAPFDQATVLRWANDLLDALEYLHTQAAPIIHRDIKPQNIKLDERGQMILLDFGLAKGTAAQSPFVSSVSLYGYTPQYAPLEQIEGTGTDARSDLYALGATMYHLLTGIVPTGALQRASAVVAQEPDPIRPPHELQPSVSPAVSAVIMQGLALHAPRRYPSAHAMRMALEVAAATAAPRRAPPTLVAAPVDRTAPTVVAAAAPPASARRSWGLLFGGAVAMLAVLGIALFGFSQLGRLGQVDAAPTSVATARATDPTDAPVAAATAVTTEAATVPAEASATNSPSEAAPTASQPTAPLATPPIPGSEMTAFPATQQTYRTINTSDGYVAVRLQPTIDSGEVMRLGTGTAVRCTGFALGQQLDGTRQWAFCPEVGGYIFLALLQPDAPAPPTVAPSSPVCDTATVVGTGALSIRAEPNRSATYLGEVPEGQTVDVLCGEAVQADERVWVRVRSGTTEGWMSTRFLRFDD